ncbi:hypothetical protein ACHAW6_000088 [Cyclotella cf. meneghiniana]
MSSLTSKETIEAKQAFEQFAADHGVCIKQYHADNGRFAGKAFKQHCSQQRQAITYCGVNYDGTPTVQDQLSTAD